MRFSSSLAGGSSQLQLMSNQRGFLRFEICFMGEENGWYFLKAGIPLIFVTRTVFQADFLDFRLYLSNDEF